MAIKGHRFINEIFVHSLDMQCYEKKKKIENLNIFIDQLNLFTVNFTSAE